MLGEIQCTGEHAKQSNGRPKFLFEPFNIDAFTGTTIELPCQGEGEPAPEVKLFFFTSSCKHKI